MEPLLISWFSLKQNQKRDHTRSVVPFLGYDQGIKNWKQSFTQKHGDFMLPTTIGKGFQDACQDAGMSVTEWVS